MKIKEVTFREIWEDERKNHKTPLWFLVPIWIFYITLGAYIKQRFL